MDLGGLGDKAKKAMSDEKTSDSVLERGEQFADDRTGGKFDAQTDKAGDLADQRLGEKDAGNA
ncbi:antitoxin [Blastococcus sp. TF02A-26]|uniref:antitoxin n=1 Tax=Blastococcus sp. TF02A-26 TaxID=2250577 RepID=UPI000DE866E7|nr:antitoxin [Blastococcus sp. TF02A-26]RBY83329.1 antitoxin [Blastococcus sp. TF02A-26]